MAAGNIAIAYGTVTDDAGRLPLLTPLSEVAGRMSIQVGAHCLEMNQGGRGMLGGTPGLPAARVVVLGGGIVGTNAERMAMGLEASVTVIDKSPPRLYDLDPQFGPILNTIFPQHDLPSTRSSLNTIFPQHDRRFDRIFPQHEQVLNADLVVGAVLVPGSAAPRLVTRDMVREMKHAR